jgi:hypothetical protein
MQSRSITYTLEDERSEEGELRRSNPSVKTVNVNKH